MTLGSGAFASASEELPEKARQPGTDRQPNGEEEQPEASPASEWGL